MSAPTWWLILGGSTDIQTEANTWSDRLDLTLGIFLEEMLQVVGTHVVQDLESSFKKDFTESQQLKNCKQGYELDYKVILVWQSFKEEILCTLLPKLDLRKQFLGHLYFLILIVTYIPA